MAGYQGRIQGAGTSTWNVRLEFTGNQSRLVKVGDRPAAILEWSLGSQYCDATIASMRELGVLQFQKTVMFRHGERQKWTVHLPVAVPKFSGNSGR